MLEMLICSGLFLLALALCGQLAMAGINTRRHSMEQNGAFRQTVTLFYQLQRDVQQCQQVYLPDLTDLAPHQPGSNSSALVLRLLAGTGSAQVVGWTLNGQEWSRTLYQNDFDPAVPATHLPAVEGLPHKVVGVDRFLVQLEGPGQHFGHRLLRLELDCSKPAEQKLISSQKLWH
jgi:hypothetical protein